MLGADLMKKKKVIAYYRKSTEANGKSKEESVAYQQEQVHQYASDHGYTIIKEFIDIGVTGVIDDRPELLSIYRYLEDYEEEVDEIFFYSIERFGREMIVNIDILQMIVEKIGKATFVREGLSSGSQHFNMLFLVYSGIAENDRENLLRTLKDGRRAKVLRYGNFDGNMPPLGYTVDSSTKKLTARQECFSTDELAIQELEIVESIYRSYLLGKSLRQIAKELNDCYGYTKRGCEWSYKSVQYILKNPAYIGVLTGVLEGTEHYYREDSNIEILIDPVIFSLVQKKLEYATTGRKRKTSVPTPTLMMCRYCGEVLVSIDGLIQCTKCASSRPAQSVLGSVANAVRDLLNMRIYGDMCDQLRKKIILQYQIKSWKLESKLRELELRREQIRKSDIDVKSKQKMHSVNTKLMSDLKLEKEIVKGIINFFESVVGTFLGKKFMENVKNHLVKLPFITLVDLIDKKVELVFIPNVLKGAKE